MVASRTIYKNVHGKQTLIKLMLEYFWEKKKKNRYAGNFMLKNKNKNVYQIHHSSMQVIERLKSISIEGKINLEVLDSIITVFVYNLKVIFA